jgi:aspartyl-tRNA synthetase
MALMADFDRVFEIAPVFRAENSNTHRHMCEFISMDLEFVIKENYMELLDLLGDLCVYMFKGVEERYPKEFKAIQE